ncbi:MAG TPA: tryptophan-rich sensory protein [Spirochaetota bacterium]|nr:tryptophan-rich sensory protein [Spirochaetota bacterium]HPN13863.1 tryptophan-rich sensory protein [Spirochaetota bacterium]
MRYGEARPGAASNTTGREDRMNGKTKRIIRLIASLIIPQLAGGIGALFTEPAVRTWYAGLDKPSFNPPGWIFGPVWTALYIMMGTALFLVWRNGLVDRKTKIAVALFGIQMALNLLWSILFFGMHNPLAGLVDIALLWAFILATMVAFFPLSRTAGFLLVPYFLWVSFASLLNYMLWSMNR